METTQTPPHLMPPPPPNFLCFVGSAAETLKVSTSVYIFTWTSTLNPYHTNRILERDYPNLYVHIFILRKIELFKDNVREKFLAWNVYLPLVYLRTSLRNVNPHKRSIYEFNWMVFSLNSSDVNPINPSWNIHWITETHRSL